MDNRYLFDKVILVVKESNEDIEEYMNNCRQEGLEAGLCIYGDNPPQSPKVHDVHSVLCITDHCGVANEATEAGMAVMGYSSPGAGNVFLPLRYVVEYLSQVEEEHLNMVYMRAHGIPITIAVTERTIIREMIPDDLPAMYGLYADEAVSKWVEPLYDYDRELEFTREYIDKMYGFYGYGLWLLFDRATDELIGRAGISHRIIDGEQCCELGYIVKGNRQKKGIGTEVSRAVMDYAANELGMEKLWLCAADDNAASIALARRLGFELYGECTQEDKRFIIYSKSLRQK